MNQPTELDLDHLIQVCEAFGDHPGWSHEGCCTPETACDLICAQLAQWDEARYKFAKTFDKPTILSLLHRLQAAEKREDQLEVCLANILHADARGQGLPFKEAMDKAHALLMYERKAP